MSELKHYVVIFLDEGASLASLFVMFFEAENSGHAREQALDAEPNSEIKKIVEVPERQTIDIHDFV
jgi:hypothetical protein